VRIDAAMARSMLAVLRLGVLDPHPESRAHPTSIGRDMTRAGSVTFIGFGLAPEKRRWASRPS
jgi:hypothetical protein